MIPALSGVELSSVGLTYPKPPTFDQWVEDGKWLARETESLRWRIGDWYNAGETYFGETAAQGVNGLSEQSIQNAAWVANRYIVSRRRESLSWSHHAEVAGMDPVEADLLLDKAESEGWSRSNLRLHRRELKAVTSGKGTTCPKCPRCQHVMVCPDCGEP